MFLSLRQLNFFGRYPFGRLIQVIQNPNFGLHLVLKNFFYKRELTDYSSKYSEFKFLDGQGSLDYIIANKASLARFSDGEVGILMGAGIFPPDSNWSQRWTRALQDSLSSVLSSTRPSLLVAVDPPKVFLSSKDAVHPIPFEWNMWVDTRRSLFKYLNKGQSYGHCHLFLAENSPEFQWIKFQSYISKRNVIVVTGNSKAISNLKLGSTTSFIECGVNNAFEKKELIKNKVYDCIKINYFDKENALIMLCLGPTACVLALEMKDLQVLDTGHIFEFAAEGFIEKNMAL